MTIISAYLLNKTKPLRQRNFYFNLSFKTYLDNSTYSYINSVCASDWINISCVGNILKYEGCVFVQFYALRMSNQILGNK